MARRSLAKTHKGGRKSANASKKGGHKMVNGKSKTKRGGGKIRRRSRRNKRRSRRNRRKSGGLFERSNHSPPSPPTYPRQGENRDDMFESRRTEQRRGSGSFFDGLFSRNGNQGQQEFALDTTMHPDHHAPRPSYRTRG